VAAGGSTPTTPGLPRSRGPGAALGAVVALVLVFLAVRLTATAPPPQSRHETDPPSTAGRAIFDLPTRGSLADDDEWLAGVAGLAVLAQLPAERAVPFAGEVPGRRIAVVLGRDGPRTTAAWLTGPPGAVPAQMGLAAPPYPVAATDPLVLWDVLAETGLLVVVARPDDAVEFLPGRSIDAGGVEHQVHYPLTLVDGIATTPLAPPVGAPAATLAVVRAAESDAGVAPALSERARRVAEAPVDSADPRGIRAGVDEAQLQALLHEVTGAYGVPSRSLSPVLLAAGPLGMNGNRAVLAGVTLPSGATVAWLSVTGPGHDGALAHTVTVTPQPAGTALTDQVIAVPAGWAASRLPLPGGNRPAGWLVISGPLGATAAVALDADDSPLATLPLVDGAGIGPVPRATTGVRLLDASGAPLGEARVARLDR